MLGLRRVPHDSTLCDTHQRLLRRPLPHRTAPLVAAAQALGLLPTRATGIVAATGLEARHVSRYYVWRTGYQGFAADAGRH